MKLWIFLGILVLAAPARPAQLLSQDGVVIGEFVDGSFYYNDRSVVRVNFAGFTLVAAFGAPGIGFGTDNLSVSGLATDQGPGNNRQHGASRYVLFETSTDCTGTTGVYVYNESWDAYNLSVPNFVVAPSISQPDGFSIYEITGPASMPVVASGLSSTLRRESFDTETGEVRFQIRCDFRPGSPEAGYPAEEVVLLPQYALPFTVTQDEDDDGIPDTLDRCSETVAEKEVDAGGCSLEQFCESIDTSAKAGEHICRSSDWSNDEPTARGPEDCTVLKQRRVQPSLCVPVL